MQTWKVDNRHKGGIWWSNSRQRGYPSLQLGTHKYSSDCTQDPKWALVMVHVPSKKMQMTLALFSKQPLTEDQAEQQLFVVSFGSIWILTIFMRSIRVLGAHRKRVLGKVRENSGRGGSDCLFTSGRITHFHALKGKDQQKVALDLSKVCLTKKSKGDG